MREKQTLRERAEKALANKKMEKTAENTWVKLNELKQIHKIQKSLDRIAKLMLDYYGYEISKMQNAADMLNHQTKVGKK